METAKKIRMYRKKSGLTQNQLAEKTGLSIATIQGYEQNKYEPKIETLQKIAVALGVSINDLKPTLPLKAGELIKKELIRVIYCNKYDKIYLNLPEPTANKKEIFFVTDNNPMIDFYVYSGEAKVKECVICHKRFLVTGGNIKTCSPKCSRINELRNKNI